MTSFSSEHVDEDYDGGWGTPPHIVRPLAEAVGRFTLDPAARPREEQAMGAGAEQYADEYVTKFDDPDGLEISWEGEDVFLNPPYGRSENPTWAEKVREEKDRVSSLTCLIASSTSADWFQDTYHDFTLTLVDRRLEFVSEDSFAPAGFDSIIASYGDFPHEYWDALRRIGSIWEPR